MKTASSGRFRSARSRDRGVCLVSMRRFALQAFIAMIAAFLLTIPAAAAPETGVGGGVGWFYAITHLHPAVYFILFLIFVLSVVNLVYQERMAGTVRPLHLLKSFFRRSASAAYPSKRTRGYSGYTGSSESVGTGIGGLPRARTIKQESGNVYTPTPLDGLNHAMPRLIGHPRDQIGAPRIVKKKEDKKTLPQDFKFSAAVDVPTHQELERREKGQLVVSGMVLGLDNVGISGVIVYLSDAQGNRVGQSCRSLADTGEFKVLVNEPGRYFLNAYKRGFVPEIIEPTALPVEAGKIEGYRVKMLPEGCIVLGRVICESGAALIPGLRVKCRSQTEDPPRWAKVDDEGRFRISGIPPDSECYLEVVRPDDKMLLRSSLFQTAGKDEVYQELIIRSHEGSVADPTDDAASRTRIFPETGDSKKKEPSSNTAPAAQ